MCSPFPVLLLAVPEAVLPHIKVRSISSAGLSLRRELCAGWLFAQTPSFMANPIFVTPCLPPNPVCSLPSHPLSLR